MLSDRFSIPIDRSRDVAALLEEISLMTTSRACSEAFLEKVTLDHEHVGADDVRHVLDVGVNREGLVDALYVAFLFNVFNPPRRRARVATPTARALRLGEVLVKRGYDL